MPANHNDYIRRSFTQHILKLINDFEGAGYDCVGLDEFNTSTVIQFHSDIPLQFRAENKHYYGTRKVTVTIDAEYVPVE
jgi:hypothetical protein